MSHNANYVLQFARTGLVTAPCSTISHLRSDASTLSLFPTHASIRHAMESGSHICSKPTAVHSSIFASSSHTKSSLASFRFSIKRLGNASGLLKFCLSKQVRSWFYRQRERSEESELAFRLRASSTFTFRVMRCDAPSGRKWGRN